MRVNPAGSGAAIQASIEGLSGHLTGPNQGWSEIVSRIGSYVNQGLRAGVSPAAQMDQLSGLLKLQVDVTRYQLRVELVSKVSESAVASMRKLQQNQ